MIMFSCIANPGARWQDILALKPVHRWLLLSACSAFAGQVRGIQCTTFSYIRRPDGTLKYQTVIPYLRLLQTHILGCPRQKWTCFIIEFHHRILVKSPVVTPKWCSLIAVVLRFTRHSSLKLTCIKCLCTPDRSKCKTKSINICCGNL